MPERLGYDRELGGYPQPKLHRATARTAERTESGSEKGRGGAIRTKRDMPPHKGWGRTERADTGGVLGGESGAGAGAPDALRAIVNGWLGTPYVWGGSEKSGADCSGFVMQVMKEWRGIELPHSSREDFKMGEPIPDGQLQPGDAVFFGPWSGVNHVGIYMGNGEFSQASSSLGVTITPMSNTYWAPKYKGARRY
jgi:cell wall-associated NlpC family hydrolase